jgi:hypothetical protein
MIRMADLDTNNFYARYQVQIKEKNKWFPSVIYACPPERFRLLLERIQLSENQRLKRVYTDDADLAMITDTIITTVT